jgi:signal transduction histidine kinase
MNITVEYFKDNDKQKKELNIKKDDFKLSDLKQLLSLDDKYMYITLINGKNKQDDYIIKDNDSIKIYYLMEGG